MKRVNEQAKQNLGIAKNKLDDSLSVKTEKELISDQLELRLADILKNPGSAFDYLLKEGDQLNIPELSQEVRISGEVQNPIGMAYQEGKNLKYYIDRSGGFSDKARRSRTFVIYSDGTTKVTHTFFKHRYPKAEPGCQIVIPAKPERQRTDNTGKWLAIASTLTTILVAISRL